MGMTLKNLFHFFLTALLAVLCWSSLTLAEPITSEVLSTPELIKALQSGRHIIYMRHSKTDHAQKDTKRKNLKDCSRQRNLSADGRTQAKKIGQAIRSLKIAVSDVLSSPYCRCKDTAKFVFGQFQIEPDLQFSISKNKEESKQLGERLYSMMMNSDAGSKNVAFVGHTSNLRDGLGIWPKPEGAMVIFHKRENKIIYKGMIKPDEWPKAKN